MPTASAQINEPGAPPAEPAIDARTAASRWRILIRNGLLLGLTLFVIQNLAIWAGILFPEPGAKPLYALSLWDDAQYLSFLAQATDHSLYPNMHMPWLTEPALPYPMYQLGGLVVGLTGWTPGWVSALLKLFTLLGTGVAFLWVLEVFCRNKAQKMAAVVVILAALPLSMVLTSVVRFFVPSAQRFFWNGAVELAFMSADGILRGGLSTTPTLTFGAISALLVVAFAMRWVETRNQRYVWLAALTLLLSALDHPFELFAAVPAFAAAVLLFDRKRWPLAMPVALAGLLGLAPYLYLAAKHSWVRDTSQSFAYDAGFSRFITDYGVSFLAIPFLFMTGVKPRSPRQKLLLLWWSTMIGVSLIPGAPFPPHITNGFAVVNGLLVVMLAVEDPKLAALYQKHRRGLRVAFALLLLILASAYVPLYAQLIRDGRSPQPRWLLSSVVTLDQAAVLDHFAHLKRKDDLVLAPDPLSWLLVRAPMHSFASHQYLSVSFFDQKDAADRFFAHKLSDADASALLQDYGVSWVVLGASSPARAYFGSTPPEFVNGSYVVMHLPDNHMKPYPGISRIPLKNPPPPRFTGKILAWLGSRLP